MRQACDAGRAGGGRSVTSAAAGMRLAPGPPPGAVPGGPRRAPDAGRGAPSAPRAPPGAAGAPAVSPRCGARGGSRALRLGAARPPCPGWPARRPARGRASERRRHARPALGPAEGPAHARGQRHPTGPVAQGPRRPRPTRGVGATADRPLVAHPGSVGGPARDQSAPRGARPPRAPRLPHPPAHPRDHAPRRGNLRGGRPRCAGPASVGRGRLRSRRARPRGRWPCGTAPRGRGCGQHAPALPSCPTWCAWCGGPPPWAHPSPWRGAVAAMRCAGAARRRRGGHAWRGWGIPAARLGWSRGSSSDDPSPSP
jgi:hypothetical protein